MPRLRILALALALAACVAPTTAPPPAAPTPAPVSNPSIGGVAMDPARSLAQNAAASPLHTSLTNAIRSAGLDPLLATGSYTLFAPTDAGFARLPPGTVPTLLDSANRPLLGRVLRYHLVPGARTRAQIEADIRAGGGVASYRTVEGNYIRLTLSGGLLAATDIHGNRVPLELADVRGSNGVMHVISGLLLPPT